MAGPFKAKRLEIKIDVVGLGLVTVGVVEGFGIELIKEGGIEYYYGSETGKHAKGTRHATFSIRRWFMTDADTDLLFDIFNDDLPFTLSGNLIGVSNSTLNLSDCQIYRYRLVTGTANDIVAEEGSGEAVDWAGTDIQ